MIAPLCGHWEGTQEVEWTERDRLEALEGDLTLRNDGHTPAAIWTVHGMQKAYTSFTEGPDVATVPLQ